MQSSSIEFLSVLGFLYLQNGKSRKAATIYETLHHLQPENLQVIQSLAYSWLETGELTRAFELTERWIARISSSEPQWRYLHIIRSRAMYELGREEEARSAMERAVGA